MTFVNSPRVLSIFIASPTGKTEVLGDTIRVYTGLAAVGAPDQVGIEVSILVDDFSYDDALSGELRGATRVDDMIDARHSHDVSLSQHVRDMEVEQAMSSNLVSAGPVHDISGARIVEDIEAVYVSDFNTDQVVDDFVS